MGEEEESCADSDVDALLRVDVPEPGPILELLL